MYSPIAQLPDLAELDLATATLSLAGTGDHWDVYATFLGLEFRLQDYVHPDEVAVSWRKARAQIAQLEILQQYAQAGHLHFAREDWLSALKHILD